MAALSQPPGNDDPRGSVRTTFIGDPRPHAHAPITVRCLQNQDILNQLPKLLSYTTLEIEKPKHKTDQEQADSIHKFIEIGATDSTERTTHLKKFFEKIEGRKDFKVGLQARFGKVFWKLNPDNTPNSFKKYSALKFELCEKEKKKDVFHPKVEEAHAERLLEGKTCIHERYRVIVNFKETKGAKEAKKVYVAIISESRPVGSESSSFTLDGVYQDPGPDKQLKINVSLPGRRYDFRIADGSAFFLSEDTEIGKRPFEIAKEIVASMKRKSPERLSVVLDGRTQGNEWNVTRLVQRLERQYLWKEGKEETKWKVARRDVGIFDLTHEHSIVDLDPNHSKIEIELWSQKFFPAQVRDMPEFEHVQGKERNWTTDELLRDFKEFLQIAVKITRLLDKY